MEDIELQLRFDFSAPPEDVVAGLSVSGLTCVLSVYWGRPADAHAMLSHAGCSVSLDERGLLFPLAQLRCLAHLPASFKLELPADLEPLLALAASQEVEPIPAIISLGPGSQLWLNFVQAGTARRFRLSDEAASAMMVARLPFSAAEDAWNRLAGLSGFPLLIATATANADGFIELSSPVPQNLEAAPLPGLFRIDETHFGLSRAFLPELRALRSIELVGDVALPPPDLVESSIPLTEALAHARSAIAGRLVELNGVVVAYRSGLGRRVAALSAVEALDAWPCLVVCPPWALWMWQRHVDLLQRSCSLSQPGWDVHVTTYLDLSLGCALDSYNALVFDDLAGEGAAALGGLARLDVYRDAYRVGIASSWPDDPELGCQLLNVVRPGEFDLAGMPLAWRYPTRAISSAEAHARAYMLSDAPEPDGAAAFRHSQTMVVPPSDAQLGEFASIVARWQAGELAASAALTLARELSAAGCGGSLSPKIGAAVSVVRHNLPSRIALLTSSRKAAAALRAALLPLPVTLVDGHDRCDDELVVFRCSQPPDLSDRDVVVVLDYPLSSLDLDEAVRPAYAGVGAGLVLVLHSPGLVDDRLASFAAKNWERGVSSAAVSVDDSCVNVLLSPRWSA